MLNNLSVAMQCGGTVINHSLPTQLSFQRQLNIFFWGGGLKDQLWFLARIINFGKWSTCCVISASGMNMKKTQTQII